MGLRLLAFFFCHLLGARHQELGRIRKEHMSQSPTRHQIVAKMAWKLAKCHVMHCYQPQRTLQHCAKLAAKCRGETHAVQCKMSCTDKAKTNSQKSQDCCKRMRGRIRWRPCELSWSPILMSPSGHSDPLCVHL